MYKISIICPTYNCEKYIGRTIESIIDQSIGFENLELIFVDDNSSDSTRDVITKYANQFDNVKLFKFTDNHGFPGAGRNYGISKAQADYIMFIDNDDEYNADYCETMYDVITYENVDVVSANHLVIKPNEIVKINTFDRIKDYSKITPEMKLVELKNIAYSHEVWSKIFKRNIIVSNNIQFIEKGLYEDMLFFYEYCFYSKRIIYLDYYGYKWYRDYENLSYYSIKSALISINSLYLISDLIKNFFPDMDLNEFFKPHISGVIIRIVLSYTNRKELRVMLDELKKFENTIQFTSSLNDKWTDIINKLLLKNRFTLDSILIFSMNKLYKLINKNRTLKDIFNKIVKI